MMLFPQDVYDSIGQKTFYIMEKITQLPDRFIKQKHRWQMINQFHKIVFVRHPFARLVSAYQNKILDKGFTKIDDKSLLDYHSTTPVCPISKISST